MLQQTSDIILKQNISLVELVDNTRMPTTPISLQNCMGGCHQFNKGKRIERYKDWKEKMKLSLQMK